MRRFSKKRFEKRKKTQRRQLGAERLEDRRLLAAISLSPVSGATVNEGGLAIVTASAGSRVRFQATLESAEQPVRGFQLNFANSAAPLFIDNYFEPEAFPAFIDTIIDRSAGDSIVSSSASPSVTVPPTASLGTFDVTTPEVSGDYLLTLNSIGVDTFKRTLIVDAEGNPLPITAYGDVILRVAESSQTIVTMSIDAQSTSEEISQLNITVKLSQVANEDVTVPFTLAGSATEGVDYIGPLSPLVIPAGSISADIELTVIDDLIVESTETVIVTLGQPIGATLGTENIHTATILDNDDATPLVTLTSSALSIQENAGQLLLNINLSTASEFDVTVPITVTGNATLGIDYQLVAGGVDVGTNSSTTVTVPSGQTSATIPLNVVDDFELETNETIIVRLDTPINGRLGAPIRQVVTIIDNDDVPPPTVNFITSSLTVGEDSQIDESIGVNLSLTVPSDAPITVPFTVSGTASDGSDFTITPSPVVFEPGSTFATINLSIIKDTLVEPDETVVITLGTPIGAVLGDNTEQTVTISNDDLPPRPTVSFQAAEQAADEGQRKIVVNAFLSAPSEDTITVPFSFSGTASKDEDYASITKVVGFASGQTERSFVVHLFDDNIIDPNETIVVSMGVPDFADIGTIRTVTLLVIDNDFEPVAKPTIQFTSTSSLVDENVGTVLVTAELSAPLDVDVAIPLDVAGTASRGTDYELNADSIVFLAGQTTATTAINVVNDSVAESSETLVISLGSSDQVTIDTNATFTLEIAESNNLSGGDTNNDSGTGNEGGPSGSNVIPLSSLASPQVVPASGQTTAILFGANATTTLTLSEVSSASLTASVVLYDDQLNVIADNAGGALSGELVPGQLYALVFSANNSDRLFVIRSSSGNDAITNVVPTNIVQPTDVDASGQTTAFDALMIVNQLSRVGESEQLAAKDRYYDVNRDGRVTALDALQVINSLNRRTNAVGESLLDFPPVSMSSTEKHVSDDVPNLISTESKIVSFSTMENSLVEAVLVEDVSSSPANVDAVMSELSIGVEL